MSSDSERLRERCARLERNSTALQQERDTYWIRLMHDRKELAGLRGDYEDVVPKLRDAGRANLGGLEVKLPQNSSQIPADIESMTMCVY